MACLSISSPPPQWEGLSSTTLALPPLAQQFKATQVSTATATAAPATTAAAAAAAAAELAPHHRCPPATRQLYAASRRQLLSGIPPGDRRRGGDNHSGLAETAALTGSLPTSTVVLGGADGTSGLVWASSVPPPPLLLPVSEEAALFASGGGAGSGSGTGPLAGLGGAQDVSQLGEADAPLSVAERLELHILSGTDLAPGGGPIGDYPLSPTIPYLVSLHRWRRDRATYGMAA